jgi:CRP-like cAMP-binding protein
MLTTVEKVLFLKSIDLFSQIPGEDLARVALIAQEETHERGEEIVAEGQVGDAMYLVVDGKVRVHRPDKEVAELNDRECFGEMSLLDGAPRFASVTTLVETRVLKISREEFREILAENPEIAQGIIHVLSRRLREASR